MTALLQGPFSFRLGLTVLHALWELALVALVVWVGLALLRRRSPQARYVLACTGLALMLALPLLTWFHLGSFEASILEPANELGTQLLAEPVTGASGLFPGLLLRALQLAPWVALFWFAGAVVMFTRLGAGLWWLDHSYRREARPVAAALQDSLDRLAARMGLHGRVRLLESARAESPLLLGWLKPVILVPSAALLQLSPAALEAILAHELAHVRRADYLMNLLQSIAEALLFFHPCAWWLSRTIRELREHCCDDAAASLCGDPLILAEGLSALERLRHRLQSDPEPALAAAKGKLMSRISRLFQPQTVPASSARGVAWTLVGASLLGAAALTAQQAAATKKPASATVSKKASTPSLRIAFQPPPPPYPAEARSKGIQGLVVLRLQINAEGTPEKIEAVQGPEELKAVAAAYAKGWRFKREASAKGDFQLNLLFELKGGAGPAPKLAAVPKALGPSATVQILARAMESEAQASADGVTDMDFSRIKVAHQPAAPAYPAEAKENRIQGTVVVSITVDEKGVPIEVKAIEGPEALAPTAVDYAKAWRFEPALQKGVPVKARFKLTMPFKLR